MIPIPLLAAVALAGPASADAAAAPATDDGTVLLAQSSVTIRERLIIRVPVDRLRAAAARAPAPVVRLREKKGPRCVALAGLAGAVVSGPTSVDLVLRGGTRVRAKLAEACPALDFYGGFYILPTADGRVCADRDAIHARWGGQCEIERFRLLVPAGTKGK